MRSFTPRAGSLGSNTADGEWWADMALGHTQELGSGTSSCQGWAAGRCGTEVVEAPIMHFDAAYEVGGNKENCPIHNGHGKSLKSTGPPSPASASRRLMMTAIAASSLEGLLDPWSGSIISIPI